MNKKYRIYKNARSAAWQALIDFGICSLPVSLKQIIHAIGAKIHTYQASYDFFEREKIDCTCAEGMTLLIGGVHHICYDDSIQPRGRVRFTLAHELGHILLGHSMMQHNDALYRTNTKAL